MYYSLPSEMREWNESSVNRNQSFFSQQSTSSNNAIIKFLQEEVNRLTEENCVSFNHNNYRKHVHIHVACAVIIIVKKIFSDKKVALIFTCTFSICTVFQPNWIFFDYYCCYDRN